MLLKQRAQSARQLRQPPPAANISEASVWESNKITAADVAQISSEYIGRQLFGVDITARSGFGPLSSRRHSEAAVMPAHAMPRMLSRASSQSSCGDDSSALSTHRDIQDHTTPPPPSELVEETAANEPTTLAAISPPSFLEQSRSTRPAVAGQAVAPASEATKPAGKALVVEDSVSDIIGDDSLALDLSDDDEDDDEEGEEEQASPVPKRISIVRVAQPVGSSLSSAAFTDYVPPVQSDIHAHIFGGAHTPSSVPTTSKQQVDDDHQEDDGDEEDDEDEDEEDEEEEEEHCAPIPARRVVVVARPQ
jgi:ribosomal protein L12E/L44/L45/RPP1/RPP2